MLLLVGRVWCNWFGKQWRGHGICEVQGISDWLGSWNLVRLDLGWNAGSQVLEVETTWATRIKWLKEVLGEKERPFGRTKEGLGGEVHNGVDRRVRIGVSIKLGCDLPCHIPWRDKLGFLTSVHIKPINNISKQGGGMSIPMFSLIWTSSKSARPHKTISLHYKSSSEMFAV